jgi:hypothetical protein
MTELITGQEWPTVIDFEYNEDETVSANFTRLIAEALELFNVFSTEDPNGVLTFKGHQTMVVHFDCDKHNHTIAKVMYLLYWFMEEYAEHLPGQNRLNVLQILE